MRQDAIAVLSPPSPHHGSRYHSPRHRTRQGQRCRQHPRVSDVHSVADLVDLVTILRVVENDARANPSRTTSARSTAVRTRTPSSTFGPTLGPIWRTCSRSEWIIPSPSSFAETSSDGYTDPTLKIVTSVRFGQLERAVVERKCVLTKNPHSLLLLRGSGAAARYASREPTFWPKGDLLSPSAPVSIVFYRHRHRPLWTLLRPLRRLAPPAGQTVRRPRRSAWPSLPARTTTLPMGSRSR